MRRLQRLVAAALAAGLVVSAGAAAAAPARKPAAYEGTADDFMRISQLFSRYNFTIDNGDGPRWAENFTPDGVFRDPSWCAIGTEQLIGVVGRNPVMGTDQEHHHVVAMGPIRYVDRNTAVIHSTVMVVREKGAGRPDGGVGITGTYDDTVVRRNGRWLFSYRLVRRPSATPPVPCAREAPYDAKIGDY